jgi:preprotein translocase subunit YajC
MWRNPMIRSNFVLALLFVTALLPFTAYADFPQSGDNGIERGVDRGFYGPQIGETVWTNAGLEGVVEAIFPNGLLSVKIGYANYNYQREQLASRGCFRRLCSGADVITTNGLEGRINGVFPSGAFSVRIGYANYTYAFEQLASQRPRPPRPPHGPGLRVGEVVWTNAGLEGTVVGIFPSGEASVKIGYANYKYSRQQLAVRGCVYDLCSGYNVITQNGLRGTVNGAFLGTQLSVKIGYANYTYDYSQLARTW